MAEPQTIQVDVVSAEGEIFSGPATMVFAPASQGDIGVAPRPPPLLSMPKPGEGRVQTPAGGGPFFFLRGGAGAGPPHRGSAAADTALRAKDIDEAAALAAKQRAEEALKERSSHISQAEALAELARAAAQLKIIAKLRKMRG